MERFKFSLGVLGFLGLVGASIYIFSLNLVFSVFISCFIMYIFIKSSLHYGDIFNPLSLFTAPWFGAYAVYLTYLYPYETQPRLSIPAHILIIGVFISFTIGWKVANVQMGNKIPSLPKIKEVNYPYKREHTELALFAMIALSLAAFFIQFSEVGGLKGLFQDQTYYEKHFWKGPIIDNIYNLSLICAVLMIIYISKIRYNLFILVVGFFILTLSIVPLSRQYFILAVVLTVITSNYYFHRVRLREIGTLVVTGILSLLTISHILSWGLVSGYLESAGTISNPIVTHIYWYFSMGMKNIEIMIEKIGVFGEGFPKNTLKPVWSMLFLKEEVGLNHEVTSNAELARQFYEGWTAPTYIEPFYFDFGYFGVFIGTFIIGWLTTYWYNLLRKKITPFRVFVYGLFANGLALTFFVNKFTQPQMVFLIIQFILLRKVLEILEFSSLAESETTTDT